jgi:DNA-binding MarR family transcriptional regulator
MTVTDAIVARDDLDRSHQVKRASRILAARQQRRKYFSPEIFGEPAWEMLLALYVAEERGPRLTVTRLCHNSGFPLTTALRWLHFLEAEHLVTRVASPVDKRIFYLDLAANARSALDRLLLESPFC